VAQVGCGLRCSHRSTADLEVAIKGWRSDLVRAGRQHATRSLGHSGPGRYDVYRHIP